MAHLWDLYLLLLLLLEHLHRKRGDTKGGDHPPVARFPPCHRRTLCVLCIEMYDIRIKLFPG
jgi:hypothetical protein